MRTKLTRRQTAVEDTADSTGLTAEQARADGGGAVRAPRGGVFEAAGAAGAQAPRQGCPRNSEDAFCCCKGHAWKREDQAEGDRTQLRKT